MKWRCKMLSEVLLKLTAVGFILYLTAGICAVLGAVVGMIAWLMGVIEPQGIPVCAVIAIIAGIILSIIVAVDNDVR